MVFLDFDKNEIGFANKLEHYGAFITSKKDQNAPDTTASDKPPSKNPDHPEINPAGPIDPHEEVNPDKDDPEDDDVPITQPVDIDPDDNTEINHEGGDHVKNPHHKIPKKKYKPMDSTNLRTLLIFLGVLVIFVIVMICCCNKKVNKNKEEKRPFNEEGDRNSR